MTTVATHQSVSNRSSLKVLTGLALAVVLAFSAFAVPKAHAEFGIDAFVIEAVDGDGNPFTQAGGHPDEFITSFELETETRTIAGQQRTVPKGGPLRSSEVDLTPGLLGNTTIAPAKCDQESLASMDPFGDEFCPIDSIVGQAIVEFSMWDQIEPVAMPLHVMEAEGVPARFGFTFWADEVTTYLTARLRDDGTYGISVSAQNVPDSLTILSTKVTIWGVPHDPKWDDKRCYIFPTEGLFDCAPPGSTGMPIAESAPATVAPQAFMTMPTSCPAPGTGVETALRVRSYPVADHPGFTDEATFDGTAIDGCENVPFNPTIEFEPTNTTADKPTGATVQVSLPQDGLLDPEGIASAHLKDTEVVLPSGMALNPAAANGLDSCSPQEIGLLSMDPVHFHLEDPNCPDASKIGTVEIETPLLDGDLTGDVYIADQNDNPFDSTFALYVFAKSEAHGVTIKLAGEVAPDPNTGRIKTTFDDAPQLPFSTFTLSFKGGERAPLVNPPTCGTKTIRADFVPWSAADPDNPTAAEVRTRTDSYQVTSAPDGLPCPSTMAERPFGPGMSSGLVSPIAGSSSPFSLRITRPDGHQEINSVAVRTPEGLTANLTGIPMCSEAQASAGNCPAASKVGTAITGAGAGNHPVYVTSGEVFLTGPYKGAPLGLLVQVPAAHGPFDLGMVNVRSALHVDPRTAQVRVESDPLPQILEGVPLRVRDIRIQMDRENFTLAPTNCQAKEVLAQARGSHGGSASLSNHFQVGECAALDFAPRFGMRILNPGRRSTLRSFNPAMRFGVAPRPGHANIGRAAVTLPRSIILDQSNIRTICTRAEFAADNCPEAAIYGWARAFTPLLDDPVQGPVYLRASDNPLPDLVADLHGQVRVSLQGRIVGTRDGRMRNVFDVVPDVPVERFQLTMFGGQNRGVLVNSTDLCRTPNRGVANFRGQNGKRQVTRPGVGLTFRGCKQVRQRIARRHAQRRAAIRQAVRQGRITPAEARRAIRR